MSTHNLCLRAKIRKNVYPCTPRFYYIKVGCKGYKSHGHVILMTFLGINHISHTIHRSCKQLKDDYSLFISYLVSGHTAISKQANYF